MNVNIYIIYLHVIDTTYDWHNDLPVQMHRLSISLLKELVEVSGIFVNGSFSTKI